MKKKYMFKHLETVDESYLQHFIAAISIAGVLIVAAIVIAIHSIFPPLFEYTGSRMLQQVLDKIKSRQQKND